MSTLQMQNVVSTRVKHFGPGEYGGAFSTVALADDDGFEVSLFVTAAQAEAIAAVFAPDPMPQTLDVLLAETAA